MKKRIFIIMFVLGATLSYAQVDVKGIIVEGNVDTTRGTFKKIKYRTIVPQNAISFNAGYGIPILTPEFSNKDVWNKKPGMNLSFGVDYKHHFFDSKIIGGEEIRHPKILGIGAGLGVSHFAQRSIMDDHTETVNNYTDKDGDVCDVILSFKGVKEKVSLTYLDIPIYLEIGRPSQVKISAYCNVGLKASILVADKIKGEGTYSATGFYKNMDGTTVNVPINGVDELGYCTDKAIYEWVSEEGGAPYGANRFALWGSISGGISIPFSSLEKNKVSSCILRLGARADYSILPVFEHYVGNNFKGITDYKSRMLLLGFDVKLIYCF